MTDTGTIAALVGAVVVLVRLVEVVIAKVQGPRRMEPALDAVRREILGYLDTHTEDERRERLEDARLNARDHARLMQMFDRMEISLARRINELSGLIERADQ